MDALDILARRALDSAIEGLTYIVFLEIERDANLRPTYQSIAQSDSDYLNSRIGKCVRARLDLLNLGRCETPRSVLIKSYERHGLRSELS